MGRTATAAVSGFGIALGLLLWLGYPLALLPPGVAGDAHLVTLPVVAIACALSLGCLVVAAPWRVPRGLAVALAVYGLAALLQLGRGGVTATAWLAALAPAAVTLAVALWWRLAAPAPRRVALVAAALWLLQVIYCLMQPQVGRETTGICLNRNWLAACLLALAPWVIWLLRGWLPRRGWWPALVATAVVALPTLYLVHRCDSRAAWLALAGGGALLAWWRLPSVRWRWLAAVAAVLVLMAGAWYGRRQLVAMHERDIRVPLWHGCLRLLADYPWRGVGPGNYDRTQVRYLDGTGYHQRLVFAPWVEHPHLEILHVAALLGVPAGLAFCWLLLPLVGSPRGRPAAEQLAQASALLLVIPGMLDKPLVQPPTALLAWLALGLCWAPRLHVAPGPRWWEPRRAARFGLAVAGLALLVTVGWLAWRELAYGWHLRRATQLARLPQPAAAQAAIAAYRRAQAWQPERVEAPYAAGTVALQQLQDPALAMDFFITVAERNPYYAHLNRLIGRAYLLGGRPDEAVTYLRQETMLFPWNGPAWQALYVTLAAAGRYDELPAVSTRLGEIYVNHARRLFGDRAPELARRWYEAMAQEDGATALAVATELASGPWSLDFKDPLLDPLLAQRPELGAALFGGFGAVDLSYWRDVAWRARFASGSAPNLALADDLLAYQPPHAVGAAGKGSPAALAFASAWLRQAGGPPPGDSRWAWPPGAFMLRNHALGVLLREFYPNAPWPPPGELPLEQAWRHRQTIPLRLDAQPPELPYLTAPFDALAPPPPAGAAP